MGRRILNLIMVIIILLGSINVEASNLNLDKEEMRGVWVSTVFNLDIPSRKGLSIEEYKQEYNAILARADELNLNTIIFQVRPKGDSFYPSEINPWSEFLTGIEGKSPEWDPLEWMIETTHKKGMDFHAWFNPYRVTSSTDYLNSKEAQLSKLSINNWARKNPSEVFLYEGKLYLNPGSRKVEDYLIDSIMEVVNKYKVDGIHLDDYFYPNKREDIDKFYSIEEKNSYITSDKNYLSLGDWRRSNIDSLVKRINSSIEEYNLKNNRFVEFGISPFGIWGHKEKHPEGSQEGVGSNTPLSSLSSYDNQFADSRKWVKNQWIDYIAPQIYWTFDEKAAPYGELVDWWSEVVKNTGVKLYIGHANYKKSDPKQLSWENPYEIINQLAYNEKIDEVKGSIFFRYKSLLKTKEGKHNNDIFLKKLREEIFKDKVGAPTPLRYDKVAYSIYDYGVKSSAMGNYIEWKDSNKRSEGDYRVYREDKYQGKKQFLGEAIYNQDEYFSYIDYGIYDRNKYNYYLEVLDGEKQTREYIKIKDLD